MRTQVITQTIIRSILNQYKKHKNHKSQNLSQIKEKPLDKEIKTPYNSRPN